MTSRGSRLRALLALVAALPLLAGCIGRHADVRGAPPASFLGFVLSTPVQLPDRTLTDAQNRTLDLAAQLKGRVTLLYVGYTRCPDVCPLVMASITRAVSELTAHEREQVQVVFVTADPVHDRPPVVARWLSKFNPEFIGVTGSTAQLRPVYAAVGMPPPAPQTGAEDTVEHAADAYAFDRQGRAQLAYDDSTGPAAYVHDLRLLLRGSRPKVADDATLATTGGVGRAGLLGLFDAFLRRRPDGSATLSLTLHNGGDADALVAASVNGSAATLPGRAGTAVPVPPSTGLIRLTHQIQFSAGAVPSVATATVLLRFRDSGSVILRVPITE